MASSGELDTVQERRVSPPPAATEEHTLTLTTARELSDVPPKDYLSTLPAELVLHIFELVRIDSILFDRMEGPISKPLLPYTDANFYHEVRLGSLEALQLFVETISVTSSRLTANGPTQSRGEHLASLVNAFELEIDLEYSHEWDEGWTTFDGLRLFGALKSVERITIACCPPLVKTITSLACSSGHLKSLRELRLSILVPEGERPWSIGAFKHLNAYKNLERLEFECDGSEGWERSDEWFELPPLHSVSDDFTLRLRELEVVSRLEREETNEDLATFISYFRIDKLLLSDCAGVIDFSTALSQASPDLLHLKVALEDAGMPSLRVMSLGEGLARLPRLQTLALSNRFFDSTIILSIQNSTSLTSLQIECDSWSHFPSSAFTNFFLGDNHPPSLRLTRLQVDLGDEFSKLGAALESLSSPSTPFHWKYSWKNQTEADSAIKFIATATAAGVEVTGDILSAQTYGVKESEV